jgi:hypothetical protein
LVRRNDNTQRRRPLSPGRIASNIYTSSPIDDNVALDCNGERFEINHGIDSINASNNSLDHENEQDFRTLLRQWELELHIESDEYDEGQIDTSFDIDENLPTEPMPLTQRFFSHGNRCQRSLAENFSGEWVGR